MKRPLHKKKLKYWFTLLPHFPLLVGKPCLKCTNVFKLEWGWRAYESYSMYWTMNYLCNDCASSRDDAIRILGWRKEKMV